METVSGEAKTSVVGEGNTPRVAVVGLGFVGLTLAVSLASRGFEVVGIEQNPEVLASLRQGLPQFFEPELEPLLRGHLHTGRLSIFGSVPEAWTSGKVDIVIITIGTPRDSAGRQSGALLSVLDKLSDVLTGGELVVLRSTVSVGTTRWMANYFEDAGVSVLVAMCPERTVEGRALIELSTLPQIVGAIDEVSATSAMRFFSQQGVSVVRVSSPEGAELAKLASNTYRDVSFAFANEIAKIAEAAGVEPHELIAAVNHEYPRSQISLPGPVGGPCLEKDPWILAESARALGVDAPIARAARLTNEALPASLVSRISLLVDLDDAATKIALLGLTFKGRPETTDVRGSPSMELVRGLSENRAQLDVWDPRVDCVDLSSAGANVRVAETCDECLDCADIVVIMTNHSFFSTPDFLEMLKQLPPSVPVLDLWPTFNTKTGQGQMRFGVT